MQTISEEPGVAHHANLVPEDETESVSHRQARRRTDARSKDDVNDAPALAQADVGVAGTDIPNEPALVALMQDDPSRVPDPFALSRRTMDFVKSNIGFTAVYHLVGIALAAIALLPSIFAGALQSNRNLAITGNSARPLRDTTSASPVTASGAARAPHPITPTKKLGRL